MIRPPFDCPAVCWRMNCRAAAWARKNTAFRFTAITSSQSRSLNSSASARRMMPALFTRMSTRPNAAVARATRSSALAALRSAAMSWNRRPIFFAAAAVSSAGTMLRPTMSLPACARASAIPRPSPVLQPVTMATFPLRSNMSLCSLLPGAQRSAATATWSMSSKVWFSPTMPQMKL